MKNNSGLKNERKCSWTDYFGSKTKLDLTQNGVSLYDTTNSNNYYVFICIFEKCKEKGAIYIARTNEICTLLEDSTFDSCNSTSSGGSVCYDCHQGGQIVQQRNCYFASIASRSCMTLNQCAQASSTYKNYVLEISVSNCGESEEKGSCTFVIAWGDIRFENNNISYNKCQSYSSIYSILYGISSTCKLSTFRGNNQTGTISLALIVHGGQTSLTQTLSYCNVIGNKCGTSSNQVLFQCRYITYVDHCVFSKNTAKFMFSIEKPGYRLTISDSFVDQKSVSSIYGPVTFIREKFDSDPIKLSHFNKENCIFEPKTIQLRHFTYLNLQKLLQYFFS